jgi:hypothetical protein
MKKAEELFSKHSCLNRAGDDEPLFVLRAKDVLAAQTIRLWATMAVGTNHNEEQIAEARMLAKQMEDWRQTQPIASAVPARDPRAPRESGQAVGTCNSEQSVFRQR